MAGAHTLRDDIARQHAWTCVVLYLAYPYLSVCCSVKLELELKVVIELEQLGLSLSISEDGYSDQINRQV